MGIGDARGYRLPSIDLVRGLAIVLMALDHTRSFYAAEDLDLFNPAGAGLALFLTRWVTHFCAPAFVFLAGVSAGLMATRKPRGELSVFLLKRGAWLVLAEIFIVSFGWTFNVSGLAEMGGAVVITMQVIWAIGAAMIGLAVLVWLPRQWVLGVGLIIIFGHNLLDPVWPASTFPSQPQPLWHGLHVQVMVPAGGAVFVFVYPLLPWIGVMAAGFGAVAWFETPGVERRRRLLQLGLAMIALFVLLRALQGYGEPNAWSPGGGWTHTLITFLNTTKYPPSLQFLLMTLGPAMVLLALAECWRGRFANGLITFGRVPFFFYLAHIYLIHSGTLLVATAQGFPASAMLTDFFLFPEGYGVSLPVVCVFWVLVVALLYIPCAWFAGIKKRRRDWWLSYL